MSAVITPEVRDSLYEVLEYLWREEQKDWEARGFPMTGHIFNHLRRVEDWLARNTGANDV